jgi:disulfide bond formation protein DsbB
MTMRDGEVCMWSAVPVRAWFATLALGAFGLVAFGLTLQHQLHLAPCPLCIFQRLLYIVIGGMALCGFALPQARLLWCALIAAMASGGVAVAAYQSWMQAFPELAKECSYADPNLIEQLVDNLGMQLPGLFLATGFCSSKEWVFLNLSMANWSMLVFAGMAAYAVLLGRKKN